MPNVAPVEWLGDKLRILDQTKLPQEEYYVEMDDYHKVADAIKKLRVRGAPAIGVAGAYGIALGAIKIKATSRDEFQKRLSAVIDTIATTRPTARNLFRAIERMKKVTESGKDIESIKSTLVKEAISIHREEVEATDKLSEMGAVLVRDGDTILTHCNTGPLATTGYGTALGIIIRAKEQGKRIKVLATETRPLLQGARLTVWELERAGVPVTLITDSAAGYFMSRGEVNCVIVGADRIAVNGDTANKIGTYMLAVLAKENGLPFYVAALTSTFDPSLASGSDIPIEERGREEITHIRGVRILQLKDCDVRNPAFDITPHHLISAIITERGVRRLG